MKISTELSHQKPHPVLVPNAKRDRNTKLQDVWQHPEVSRLRSRMQWTNIVLITIALLFGVVLDTRKE